MSKQVHTGIVYDVSYVRLVDHDRMLFNLVTFQDITFEKCRFNNVAFVDCVFSACNFIECSFNSCSFAYTRFEVELSEVSFRDSHFLMCNFEAGFVDASIAYSILSRCDLSRSSFTQLAMTEVVLHACQLPDSIPVIQSALDMIKGREFAPYIAVEVGRAYNYKDSGFDDYTWGTLVLNASDPFWKKRGG